ncbi:MAG: IS21 family transposase, partial [Actinomycetia bacterium]|nr:IS21 family transposase [Actinomycetes bacterium]
ISRELKINRKTVRKYISEHESEIKSNDIENHLEQGLSSKPRYKTHNRSRPVLTHDIEEEINSCLKKNKEKINNGMRKQVMKKIDIFNYLQEKSYLISYPTVCNYIRNTEKQGKESFIKQLYHPGEICEFDWGEVKIHIDGKLQAFNMAVFTSAYSNYRFAKLFYRQDSLAFSQSHIDFFSYTGGVYKTMVYDNMRVAVAKFVGRSEKTPTRALLELSSYYKFGFRFCNVRCGNEKGHVEKSVDYIRRKSFSVKDEFANVGQANEHLLQSCKKLNGTGQILKTNQTANELFEDEKNNLFVAQYPYKCFEEDHAKVDKYSTISYKKNRYSVPDFLVGRLLDIKIFAEKIDIYFNGEKVSSHTRSYGLHTWEMDINHYLASLKRKPGALKGSLALNQLNEKVKEIREKYFDNDAKDFIELLQYCKDKNICFAEVENAVGKIKKITPTSIGKDKILAVISKEKELSENKAGNTSCQPLKLGGIEEQSIINLQNLTAAFN